jgi:hypothetical protein
MKPEIHLKQGCTNFPKIMNWRHIEDPQMIGASVQNLVTTVMWLPGFLHP